MLSKLSATFSPRQLRYQLALLTSLVLLLTIFVYAWYSADEQAQFAQERSEVTVVALAQNIAVTSTEAIILKNFAELEGLLVRMVGLPNIQELRITDARGRLLSHVVRKPGGKPEVRFGSRTIDTPAAANAATRVDYSKPDRGWRYQFGLGDPGRMVARQPIFSGTLLGWVVVDFDLAFIADIRKHIWSDSLAAGAIALIASILLLLLFLKRPMGALQTATNFATRLDESRGAQLPVFHGSSEIESLTTALNRVSTRLLTQNRDLNNQQLVVAAQTADLLASREYLRTIVDAALDAVITMNEQGLITDWNPEAERIFGYSRADAVGNPLDSLVIPPALREAHRNGLKHFLKTGVGPVLGKRIEITAMRAGGGEFPVEMAIVPIRSGEFFLFNAFLRDITERKRIEEDILQLNTQLSQFKNTLDQTLDCVFMFDPESLRFTYVNKGAMQQVGYSETELMQMTLVDIMSEFSLAQFQQVVQPLIEGAQPSLTFQSAHRHKDGHDVPVEVFLQLVRLEGQIQLPPPPPRFVAIVSDISERKQTEQRIAHLANHDALTDLPNRHLLQDRIQQALIHARRNGNQGAVLFVDLDKFKFINDTMGHDVGDLLLKEVAQRLVSSLRSEDTVARTGGDEFIVVLHSVANAQDAGATAQKLLDALLLPYRFAGKELRISASIGIAVFPDDGEDMDTLLKNSDAAMYHAKEAGRNNCQFFARK